jgi:hypothetical protein
MIHRHPLHVACDPADLAAVIEAIEALGHHVECPAYDARERLKERNGFLLQALERMPGGTPRKKCRELAAAIARFEGTTWPRWRDHGTPPGGSRGISMVESCLFEARQLGRLPTTPEQLWNIVAKFKGRCNLAGEQFSSASDLK